jgi:NAD(P)-dependent dehydrogenase (short-subunit alcohol dehydrogenase family)
VVQLLAGQGAEVRAASRNLDRARAVCEAVAARVPSARVSPARAAAPEETAASLQGCQVVIAAGALGVMLLPAEIRRRSGSLQVAIDLNAVQPPGLEGIAPADRGEPRDGVLAYGAIGIGGVKMKLHKAALRKLFTSNDLVLDAAEIFELGRSLPA